MDENREKKLEELIHRELRQLPERPAPATLVHRVMLAVHARARRPWWERSWVGWPLSALLFFYLAYMIVAARRWSAQRTREMAA